MPNARRSVSDRCALAILLVTCTVAALLASPAVAQAPHPNGCSIAGGVQWIQQGLDRLFLGACNRHDRCWAQCNGPNPPYLGLSHKFSCDAQFFIEMEAACLAISATLSFPLDDIEDAAEFLEVCASTTAVFSAAVAANVPAYWRTQCLQGCNASACSRVSLPMNPLCGFGQCYVNPPNFPPINTCTFADCNSCIGPNVERCCPDCTWPPGPC